MSIISQESRGRGLGVHLTLSVHPDFLDAAPPAPLFEKHLLPLPTPQCLTPFQVQLPCHFCQNFCSLGRAETLSPQGCQALAPGPPGPCWLSHRGCLPRALGAAGHDATLAGRCPSLPIFMSLSLVRRLLDKSFSAAQMDDPLLHADNLSSALLGKGVTGRGASLPLIALLDLVRFQGAGVP